MARRKASTPSVKTDLTRQPIEDDVIDWVPEPMEASDAKAITSRRKIGGKCKQRSIDTILSQWKNVMRACKKGYEYPMIASAIGVTRGQFNCFVAEFPEARRLLSQFKLQPRDVCINVVLNAARRGDWLPAAWYLERKHWQEFAKPEVSLQMLDRAESQNEVVQTFGGRSLAEINKELREQHHGNPDFQRALEQIDAQVAQVKSELGTGEGPNANPEDRPKQLD